MSIESRSRQYGRVFDHWQIREFLGSGSGGKTAVFRLARVDSARGVSALKIVNLIEERGSFDELSDFHRKEYEAAREECSRSAEQEVWLMDELRGNTNIVDYLDHTFVDWSEEDCFGRDLLIRMELLTDLRSELRNGRMFTEAEVLKIGRDICVALELCHNKNILHRDVKPENIFRNKDGAYKLGDFGVSRVLDACPGAVASTGIGTYEYWPAEQMTGSYDKRVDIYSLGLVLYELSNRNRLPFAASTYVTGKEVSLRLSEAPMTEPTEVNQALARVILKACAFRPADRYQSAEDFLKALDWLSRKNQAFSDISAPKSPRQEVPSVRYETVPARPSDAPKTAFETQPAQKREPTFEAQRARSKKSTAGSYLMEQDHRKKKMLPIFLVALLLCAVAGVFVGPKVWTFFRYSSAKALLEEGKYNQAVSAFESLGNYRDSLEKLKSARLAADYEAAKALSEEGKYEEAIAAFEALGDYWDSAEKLKNTRFAADYAVAESLAQSGKTAEAAMAFYALGEKERSFELWGQLTERNTVSVGSYHTVGLKTDGTVVSAGADGYGQCDVDDWTDIIAVSAGSLHTVGLKTDGTVVSTGYNAHNRCDVCSWADIVAVSAGSNHTVGLKTDGTVVSTGNNEYGQCNLDNWMNIVAISAGYYHTVGLKADGTVVAAGSNRNGRCDVSGWIDIVSVSAGTNHTVGLKADGTVVAVGNNLYGQCNVDDWTNIIAVSAGSNHTVGLKADGTVVAVGGNVSGQCNVSDWTDIAVISAGPYQTMGLKADGTLVGMGNNSWHQLEVENWSGIILPASNRERMMSVSAVGQSVEEGAAGKISSTIPDTTTAVNLDSSTLQHGVVFASELNIRSSIGQTNDLVGTYSCGDQIVVQEICEGWGRTDKGWVNLNYVRLFSSESEANAFASEVTLTAATATSVISDTDTYRSATIPATVSPSESITEIQVSPKKETFCKGDILTQDNLTVKATYQSGKTETLQTGVSVSPSILSTAGTQTVSVSYGGFRKTINVEVIDFSQCSLQFSNDSPFYKHGNVNWLLSISVGYVGNWPWAFQYNIMCLSV